MSDDLITTIITEFREEFHIPPFYEDSRFQIFVKDAEAYFKALVPEVDFETDANARKLLRNYMFYQHENKLKDFYIDYMAEVLHWQFSCFYALDDEEDTTEETTTEETEETENSEETEG